MKYTLQTKAVNVILCAKGEIKMKFLKTIVLCSLILAGLYAVSLAAEVAPATVPVGSDLTKATVVTQVDLPALLSRKTYRLGIRAGLLSPTEDINLTKDSSFNIGLDFDAKMNENLDWGPRFTYQSVKYKTAVIDATYGVLMFGYGARMYLSYWGDYGSTHGFVNAYIAGEANYCVANKSSEVLAASPANFAGFAANGGVGIELAFGPNSTGFVDLRYQKSSIHDSAGVKFPLDGYVINVGTRLAFI